MFRICPFLPILVLSLVLPLAPVKTQASFKRRFTEYCASFLERYKIIPIFGRRIPRDLSADEFWTNDPGFLISFSKWSNMTRNRWMGVRYFPGTKSPGLSVVIDLEVRRFNVKLHGDHGILPNVRRIAWSLAEAKNLYSFDQTPQTRITRENDVVVESLEFSPSALYFARILIEMREINSFSKPIKLDPADTGFLRAWFETHFKQDELVWQSIIRFHEIVHDLSP